MQIRPFTPGRQTKGTLVLSKDGNVFEVLKDIANAKAQPSAGAYYRLAMTAAEYLESQQPEGSLTYEDTKKLLSESKEIPSDLKRVLLFLLENKADLKDGKVSESQLRAYRSFIENNRVIFREITDEEAANLESNEHPPLEPAKEYTPAQVGISLPVGASGSLRIPVPFKGTIRLWDGVTPYSSEFDCLTDEQRRPVALIPGTNTWLVGKTAMKDGAMLRIDFAETLIMGIDEVTGNTMFTMRRPAKKLFLGLPPKETQPPAGLTHKGLTP